MDASAENSLMHLNDFDHALHDFIEEANFNQCIDLIRGECEDPVVDFDTHDLIHGCFMDNQFGVLAPPGDMYDYNATMVSDVPDHSIFHKLPCFEGNAMDHEEDIDDEDSSATTTTTTTTPTKRSGKVDRSRTLISERRRRGRMKEKLYALRSLVPNITKMDKASIVGDAVLYVQELQMKAKKLKAEIAGLEASLAGSKIYDQGPTHESPKKTQVQQGNHLICKKIIQMDVFQVEEREFYVRLASSKGRGVSLSLYKALESLTGFIVQSSNLATVSDRFVLTFTLNVRDCEKEMNLPNLKLWVAGALLNQGFEFIIPLSA
ncbi:transcription factor FER-LIKE IRON DEFICIENCY-INDUCED TRANSCRIPTION FACTOR [Juglans microcarpa x Juglans regia]|uniref:transcription factor FER-LIKE IRON DEFICIENCY-INDUCED TRANSCRIPTION FACTOR n=1 Tax=Juglans microcarpa x Juglans regia TaxID=2249226 RepID=UPI001B7F4556|nr:transcription factor FER-LIKE IRON DEFICIENCY-INDUCED TRANSCRIPTION FACTOR [Juglans microcarpa x Juglans regia]